MPRKVRNSKSKTTKSNNNTLTEHQIIIDEENRHDLNGSVNLSESGNRSVNNNVEISKKRSAEVTENVNDANSDEIGPPRKKRNNQDVKKTVTRAMKRPFGSSDEDSVETRVKSAKIDEEIDTNRCGEKLERRVWTQSIGAEAESVGGAFVVACFDLAAIGGRGESIERELDAVGADLVCVRAVRRVDWIPGDRTEAGPGLECALRLAGFEGDFYGGEDELGVVTVYRASRFRRVDIDCGRLSKLCLEQIPLSGGSGLDEASLEAVKRYLDEPGAYIVTVLSDREATDGQLLIIGNAHLSSPRGGGKQDVRCVQAVGMLWRIWRMISQIKSDVINNNNSSTSTSNQSHLSVTGAPTPPPPPCWILCGDLNSVTDNSDANGTQSPVFQICRDGYPDEVSIRQLQALHSLPGISGAALVDVLWHSFQHPLADLSSPYSTVMSHEPTTDSILLSRGGLQANRVLVPVSSLAHPPNNHQPHHHNSNSSHQCHPSSPPSSFPSQSLISLACEVSFKTAPSE